jgi:hypothetical protein
MPVLQVTQPKGENFSLKDGCRNVPLTHLPQLKMTRL